MERCKEGENAYSLAKELYPIYRSITGDGVRKSLEIIRDYIDASDFKIYEVKTGTKAFDWNVPKEWRIRDGYIESETGERYAQFSQNNLHIMGYSVPVDKWVKREELENCIYTQQDQMDAIPYVTSYYKERYGFCMSENEKQSLIDGTYHMFIDSELFDGSLTYADCLFEGKTKDEIVISTYCCHPQMANDNCSGMVLLAELAKYVKSLNNRYYSYRFAFFPETIGAIVYLSQNDRLEYMKKHTLGGYTFSCVGDDGNYSLILSREGNSISDRALKNVLSYSEKAQNKYKIITPCEPQLGKRGLYPTVSKKGIYDEIKAMMDFIGYADGKKDLIQISEEINQPVKVLIPIAKNLLKEGLITSED